MKCFGIGLVVLSVSLCLPTYAYEVTKKEAQYHKPIECKIAINGEPLSACTDVFITRGTQNINFHLNYGDSGAGYSFVASEISGKELYTVTAIWIRESKDEHRTVSMNGSCVLLSNGLRCAASLPDSNTKINALVRW